jgi:hypothetical protein
MKKLLLSFIIGACAFAAAQNNNAIPAEGFTIYQTIVSVHAKRDLASIEQEQRLAGRITREYSKHPDGREVLAEVDPAMLKELGHPLHVRRIWEPNGVMTRVMMPWKNFDVVVEPNNGRLSGNAKAGSPTCEPANDGTPTYVGNESLQGLDTYRWRWVGPSPGSTRTDKWYWRLADCLEVQVEHLGRNADGSLSGGYYNIRLDRMAPQADLELFFIPENFTEGSYMTAQKKYVERTLGNAFTDSSACYKAGASKPDPYEANHAEALRRRALATTGGDKQ